MNRYQKALDTLKGFLEDEWKDMNGWCNEVIPENLNILQELVDEVNEIEKHNKEVLGI